MLEQINPDVFKAFEESGFFPVFRTGNPFSAMGLDQRLEQHNKALKGDGGAVHLTENDAKLQR